MKKHNSCILFFTLAFFSQSAFAYDMSDGVWKNLIEKYDQTQNNTAYVSGMLNSRLYYNGTYASNPNRSKYSDTYFKGRYGVNFNLSHGFSVKVLSKLEKTFRSVDSQRRNQMPSGSNGRLVEDEALFLDEMVLGYDYKNFSGLVGKFDVNFGDAWRSSNGIWTNEIAKSRYEQNNKLGAGVIQRFGDKQTIGEYVFGASAFTLDRKNFDNSAMSSADQISKSDGKPSDTRSLKSYVLSTDIYYDFGGDETLSYHFAYINSAINPIWNASNASKAKLGDENAYAANMKFKHPFSKNINAVGFGEYVKIDNLGGDTESDSQILTLNLTTNIKDFFVTLGRAAEKQTKLGAAGTDRYINELSIGYNFDHVNKLLKGLTLIAGYKQDKVDNKTTSVFNRGFAVQIAHKFEF